MDTLDQHPPIRQVAGYDCDPRVHVFRCGDIVDSFVISTERYLVLVDTMISRGAIAAVMCELPDVTTRPLLVINTHADWDHVWGNGLFDGPEARYPAPIIGHQMTAERLAAPEAAALLASFQAEHPARYASAELRPPTIRFRDGLTVAGGDLTLELMPTPGHTADHVAVWIPEIRLLLAGDAAELPFPHVGDPAGLPQLRASLQRLAALDADRALYCHAAGITSPALIDHNIWYFEEMERRCRVFLGGAETPSALDVAALGWPLEEALPPGVALHDLPDIDFYRTGHEAAFQATLHWLEHEVT